MSEHPIPAHVKSKCLAGTLYIVATPIGNLGDITLRALDVLREADLVACEDTRTTGVLLHHYNIQTPTISYNDHNGAKQRPLLLEKLQQKQTIALVSDAGTPLISDPGYKLVAEARALGIPVSPIPGASSVMAALCGAALPTDMFTFAGFLPAKEQARASAIAALANLPTTLVLLESPRRLLDSLQALHQGLGDRQTSIARELTKLYEEFRNGSLSELIAHYEQAPTPKGEIVIVIAPPEQAIWDDAKLDAALRAELQHGSVKQAAATIAELSGSSKSLLYQRALALKDEA